MNSFSHGGDLKSLAADAGRPEREILDFSVNLRPEGMPEFIASALWKAMDAAVPYPSPDMAELRELAAVRSGLPSGCFTFGNGANELIHALPRALELKRAVIPEPAFSEYRLACLRHGTDVLSHPDGGTGFLHSVFPPAGGTGRRRKRRFPWLIPAIHPAGCWTFRPCGRPCGTAPESSGLLTNPAIDYADGTESLLRDAALLPNLVVLRSLTKCCPASPASGAAFPSAPLHWRNG